MIDSEPHAPTGEADEPAVLVPRSRPRKATRPVRLGLRITLALVILFVVCTWLFAGPVDLNRLDVWLSDRAYQPQWRGVLISIDRIGQRAICLPVLVLVTLAMVWKHRSLRPAVLSVVTMLAVNLVVMVLKFSLGRGAPYDNQFQFFADGEMYPSGHGANIVSMYGLAAYLLCHYGAASTRMRSALIAGVGLFVGIMTFTSMALQFHWFSDLVAGYLVGGAILALVAGIDAAVPFRSPSLVVAPPVDPYDVLTDDEIREVEGRTD